MVQVLPFFLLDGGKGRRGAPVQLRGEFAVAPDGMHFFLRGVGIQLRRGGEGPSALGLHQPAGIQMKRF